MASTTSTYHSTNRAGEILTQSEIDELISILSNDHVDHIVYAAEKPLLSTILSHLGQTTETLQRATQALSQLRLLVSPHLPKNPLLIEALESTIKQQLAPLITELEAWNHIVVSEEEVR